MSDETFTILITESQAWLLHSMVEREYLALKKRVEHKAFRMRTHQKAVDLSRVDRELMGVINKNGVPRVSSLVDDISEWAVRRQIRGG